MKRRENQKSNWLDPNTTAENERLPKWFGLAWTTRGTSVTINAVFIAYITYYATDMLGLSAGLIGFLILLSKIFDAFTDLIAGFIIDKTNTKWGKARPYEIFILFTWLFTIIMFSIPDWSTTAKASIIFIMYSLINAVCITFLGAEDAVYMARSIRNTQNRISVMSVSGAIGMIAAVVFSIIFPQLMATVGATKEGWSYLAMIIGIPCGLIGLLRMVLIKEVVVDEKVETTSETKVSFKQTLGAVMKNKYIFIIALINFITFLIANLSTTVTTYYFKYIVGDIRLMSIASLGVLATPVLLIVFPMLTRKFGTTNIMRGAIVFGIIGLIIRSIGGTNMTTIVIGGLIASIASIPVTVMINAYLIDCMDYGEWKSGIRVEGMLNSISNFMAKFGTAVSSGVVGLILSMAGYNGATETQVASANQAIIALYNYLPLALYVVMFLLAMAYTIDKFMPKVRESLSK
ncbi:MFS transporter [Streptococcus moroccensis]|uniref:Sugar (Glycoside-pentoside-hexuronide) transporter n=1 Tax=Streptococcus moroccensis TaxID=1451356 RepID=A0ABT9YQG1_9STRE|nr:glycoside-pentoside-hexuronide (GPH):cation symporter [Streptococcus moroccensis]MDQ0221827.1 sugar (glycoside-pentoside-hexuronide) transporter [Streptococcus moroccensis]